MTEVVVIGSGFAAVAAASAAVTGGAAVTLVRGRAGASSFWAGAVDVTPWDELARAGHVGGAELRGPAVSREVELFLRALGDYRIVHEPEPAPRLATVAGVVRQAAGHDLGLLDLARLDGREILVPRADRAGWDADSLVRSLAVAGVGRVRAVSCPVLRYDEEHTIADGDLAARHDDPARLAWLVERLREQLARSGQRAAFLLGPWLGIERARAAELSERVGAPVGEALSGLAGTAGLRFESARDRWLEASGIRVIDGWATAVEAMKARVSVVLEGVEERLSGDAVVLATGGLVGGGVVFDPPEHGSGAEGIRKARSPFRLGLELAGAHVASGLDFGVLGAAEGPVLDRTAWPLGLDAGALERCGVQPDADGGIARSVFAAGDVVFGARRTLVTAIASGLRAGAAAAAGHHLTSTVSRAAAS